MKFEKFLNEKRVEKIKHNNSINSSEKLYLELSKYTKLDNEIFKDTYLIGKLNNNKINVLFIGGQHGTENSSPWALVDAYKNNILNNYDKLNICSIPILNIESFNSSMRDISNKDDLTIIKNFEKLNKFNYIFSLHEDHQSKLDKFYMYVIDIDNNVENFIEIKDNIEKLKLEVDERLSYNSKVDGIFFNKFSHFPEELIIQNNSTFIRTEISGKMDFEKRKNIQSNIIEILLNWI